jgi:hypothetical protein
VDSTDRGIGGFCSEGMRCRVAEEGSANSVVLRGAHGDQLTIDVLGRVSTPRHGILQSDWLASPLSVRAGAFVGRVDATLRARELASLREALERIYRSSQGSARLVTELDWLMLDLAVERGSHVALDGRLSTRPGGNELRFRILVELGSLAAPIAALVRVEHAYLRSGRFVADATGGIGLDPGRAGGTSTPPVAHERNSWSWSKPWRRETGSGRPPAGQLRAGGAS